MIESTFWKNRPSNQAPFSLFMNKFEAYVQHASNIFSSDTQFQSIKTKFQALSSKTDPRYITLKQLDAEHLFPGSVSTLFVINLLNKFIVTQFPFVHMVAFSSIIFDPSTFLSETAFINACQCVLDFMGFAFNADEGNASVVCWAYPKMFHEVYECLFACENQPLRWRLADKTHADRRVLKQFIQSLSAQGYHYGTDIQYNSVVQEFTRYPWV